jgi:hypothetical protein
MTEACHTCRFWLADRAPNSNEAEDETFGWCRRHPPKIIDHMARIAIRTPGFGGNVVDPEDVASSSTVSNASMFPATYATEWCGRFERLAVDPHPAWLQDRQRTLEGGNTDDQAVLDGATDRSIELDEMIFSTPAATHHGLTAKLLLVAVMAAEGECVAGDVAAQLVTEAQLFMKEAAHG